jgi:hypothetical protein
MADDKKEWQWIFYGPVIHSKSIQELTTSEKALLVVTMSGKICRLDWDVTDKDFDRICQDLPQHVQVAALVDLRPWEL